MLRQGEAAVDVVSVVGLLPLGVGAGQDVVRAVIGIIDGAVFGVGGAGQVAARPRKLRVCVTLARGMETCVNWFALLYV